MPCMQRSTSLSTAAGLLIIIEAVKNLAEPHTVGKLDYGIILISLTAAVNYDSGEIAVRKETKNSFLALVAGGRHL